MLLATGNDKRHGLGMALPMGGVTIFEPSPFGEQLVSEERIRDYAEGQEVELALGQSHQVFAQCEQLPADDQAPMKLTLTNANRNPVRVRVVLGPSGQWNMRGLAGVRVKDGEMIAEVTVSGNGRRELQWELRSARDS